MLAKPTRWYREETPKAVKHPDAYALADLTFRALIC